MNPSVAIIGAGWSGLTVAVRLADAGCRVTVFESSRVAGGRARSLDWQGIPIDNGQHLLVGAYSATLNLMTHVGGDVDTAFLRTPLTVEVPGRLSLRLPVLPAPLHLAFGLLGAGGASLGEKISAVLFMKKLQAARYRLPVDLPVADWLDAGKQVGTLRAHLWEPLCLAALNTRPHEASAQVFANVLRDTLGADRRATDMLLPATDLGNTLPRLARDYLAEHHAPIHFSSRVIAIEPSVCDHDSAWQIGTRDTRLGFDQVVIATAPHHVADLLPDHPVMASLRTTLATMPSEPIATIYLQYPASVRLDHPLIALNHGQTQWLADRGQLGGPAGLLAHVLSGHGPWEMLDDDALTRQLHDDTTAILGRHGFQVELPPGEHRLVIREKRATFRCLPNLHRPEIETPMRGLWLAGDYTASDYPGTLESAIRSGESVAASIIHSIRTNRESKQAA